MLSIFLVIMMSLSASCGPNPAITTVSETDNSQLNNIITSSIRTDDAEFHYLVSSQQENLASVKTVYFEGENEVNSLITSSLNAYLYNYIGTGFGLMETTKVLDPKMLYTEYTNNPTINKYLVLDCVVKYESLELTSLVFSGTIYGKSAAHPSHLFFSLNIDRSTGERILTRDIYPVDEQLYNIFDNYAYTDLQEKANAEWLASIEKDDLYTKNRFFAGLQEESDYCTYFTATHLGISYPVPFALGNHIEVEIPYSDLGIIIEHNKE